MWLHIADVVDERESHVKFDETFVATAVNNVLFV